MNVLFVTNGHGEAAIAARIARELRRLGDFSCDHVRLVGTANDDGVLHAVGPAAQMPSGGLVAMGNARNFARDLRAGLALLTIRQWRFLRSSHDTYAVAVAVGDIFALCMTLAARLPTIFVGTAKSAYFAPYGKAERWIMRKARVIFVRDGATADQLRKAGIRAMPANVMADLFRTGEPPAEKKAGCMLAILPGSRERAYEDARFLMDVYRAVAVQRPDVYAMLSIAPGLEPAEYAKTFSGQGWKIEFHPDDGRRPFALYLNDREVACAWMGDPAPIVSGAALVLGQAGSANESAAALGIPVIAFSSGTQKSDWYRARQAALLGEALLIAPRDVDAGASEVLRLLDDASRREQMSAQGISRLGPPGAAASIAARIAQLCA